MYQLAVPLQIMLILYCFLIPGIIDVGLLPWQKEVNWQTMWSNVYDSQYTGIMKIETYNRDGFRMELIWARSIIGGQGGGDLHRQLHPSNPTHYYTTPCFLPFIVYYHPYKSFQNLNLILNLWYIFLQWPNQRMIYEFLNLMVNQTLQ